MSFAPVVVAVVAFTLAALWLGVGTAGALGRLPRNRWFGVRAVQTMKSAQAFTTANRIAAPGTIGAGVISALGGALALGVAGGIVFGVVAVVAALLLIGVVSGLSIRAVTGLPADEEPAGCSAGCCSGEAASESAAGNTASGNTASVGGSPADDCGQSSCGSCALSGMCTGEAIPHGAAQTESTAERSAQKQTTQTG